MRGVSVDAALAAHPATAETARIIHFTVRGTPTPQGSSRAFVRGGRAIITSDNKGLSAWRNAIATAAASAMGDRPVWTAPCLVWVTFSLPRPKSAPRRIVHHATRPDLDKLVRALLDGMTSVVWRDDAQVVQIWATKGFGNIIGATVRAEACE